jgi:Uma2 family endonuclease
MTALPKYRYTLEEYIQLDKNSEDRYEFFEGDVFAMSGGSIEHSQIASNINRALGNRLAGRPCRVLTSDTRLKVASARPYRYPDVVVVCGKLVTEESHGQVMLVNPQLIVEVLSASTEAYDRGEKFRAYQSIESFREYLLIAQNKAYITHYVRQPDGAWLREDIEGLERSVTLPTLECVVPFDEIYDQIEFPPEEPAPF